MMCTCIYRLNLNTVSASRNWVTKPSQWHRPCIHTGVNWLLPWADKDLQESVQSRAVRMISNRSCKNVMNWSHPRPTQFILPQLNPKMPNGMEFSSWSSWHCVQQLWWNIILLNFLTEMYFLNINSTTYNSLSKWIFADTFTTKTVCISVSSHVLTVWDWGIGKYPLV